MSDSVAPNLDDLLRMSLDRATVKLAAKEGFSLVGYCVTGAGERNGILIHSDNDEQMAQQAKDLLRDLKASAFALVGEGSVFDGSKAVPVLIVYLQETGWEEVRVLVIPYELQPTGEPMLYKPIPDSPLEESWLVAE